MLTGGTSIRLRIFGFMFLFAICGAGRASAQSQFFCWVAEVPQSNPYAEEGEPAYFTALITARDKDQLARGLFAQYVETKYSVRHHGQPYCTQLTHCPQGCQAPGSDTNLQDRIEWVKQHGGKAIMTDWTPDKHAALMAEAAKNPVLPPSTAAEKKAPPLAAQTAYEKAMAAQRPQAVSQAQLAAASKAATPPKPSTTATAGTASAPSTGEKYIFCESTGSPYRGKAQSHYYVTQIFPAPIGNTHPQDAFKAYLHGAHREEDISSSSCTHPGPKSAEESTRRSYIENQRTMPNRAIVELNWKPAS